jgi:hypothetical protein
MASYRIVNGQKVLVEATQRPAPASPSAAPEPDTVVSAPAVDVKPLAGLAPTLNPSLTEEPSNGW